jgi:CubicO group peptidase (beta-lactamase class C family)
MSTPESPHRRSLVFALPFAIAGAPLSAAVAPSDADLGGLSEEIEREFRDLESLVALRDGQPLFEFFRKGTSARELRDLQSVTKAVLSLLVGIAIARGAIKSVDQPVLALLKGKAKVDRARATQPGLTVRHLLTMTAGFEGGSARIARSDSDNPHFLMRRPVATRAGSAFRYDNPSSTLLSIVLQSAVGMRAADFARDELFVPLGISRFEWAQGPNGHNLGADGLRLASEDMAKIGELVLHNGRWHGRQIVPEDFIRAATSPQVPGGPPVGAPFGFLWWTSAGNDSDAFYAYGYGGQLIWVHRPLDLVVATSAPASAEVDARGHAHAAIGRLVQRL